MQDSVERLMYSQVNISACLLQDTKRNSEKKAEFSNC